MNPHRTHQTMKPSAAAAAANPAMPTDTTLPADTAEELVAVLGPMVSAVPVAKPVTTAVPDVLPLEALSVALLSLLALVLLLLLPLVLLAAALLLLLLLDSETAGHVRLYFGVVEKLSVTAKVALSCELESYIVYHHVFVLPKSSQPTWSQYFCAFAMLGTASPVLGPAVGQPVSVIHTGLPPEADLAAEKSRSKRDLAKSMLLLPFELSKYGYASVPRKSMASMTGVTDELPHTS